MQINQTRLFFALLWRSELVSCELLVTIESTMWVRGNLTKYHYIINSSNIKFCWGSFCWNKILEITVNFDWHLWWRFFLLSCLMSTVMLWKRHLTVFCVRYIVMADTMPLWKSVSYYIAAFLRENKIIV